MTWQVRFTQTSLRQLEKLDASARERVISKLESVAAAEAPLTSVKRLKGGANLYSLRVGDYRAILAMESKVTAIILVLQVGHRSKTYRDY